MNNNGNILLNRIIADGSLYKYKEFVPPYEDNYYSQVLTKQGDDIFWTQIDLSLNVINNHFGNTDIYYDFTNNRAGIGRYPLFNYKIDLAVPKNKVITAFHIGDGSFGFSMGNGTAQGFIPEIIGIGSDENDTGLYLLGIAGNENASNIPLIILDGRSAFNTKLKNRPILGITSANYNDYIVKVDEKEDLIVKGKVNAKDIIIENLSLLETISKLQKQINELKTKIT